MTQPCLHHRRRDCPLRRRPSTLRFVLVGASACIAVLLAPPVAAEGIDEVPGFTEPYRQTQVACAESGILARVEGRVGDRVRAGQVLAVLESSEHLAQLALAEHQMAAQGRLDAALAEARLHKDRLDDLTGLAADGYAHREELQRAQMQAEIAEANVRAAREDLVARALEAKKIRAQLNNRTLRAPQDGLLVDILKMPGEFVSYNDPNVLVLVETDRLLAVFCIPEQRAAALRVGQTMRVRFASQPQSTEGVIEVIAPVTDAESGTVRVQLLLDNSDQRRRAGERCHLELPH